ncbi:MAG: hypothetical protein ACTSRZ_18620 [Promethearchaeota archaeon]
MFEISERFKRFVVRVGRISEFLPISNRLLNTLVDDAKNKYKNYPNLVQQMANAYNESDYKRKNAIAYLLRDHNEFLISYLTLLFPFRKRSLAIIDVDTPSPLDYIVETSYTYKADEIEIVKNILESKEWPKNPDYIQVCNYIFLYCLQSYAIPIKEIFGRSFAFFPLKVKKTPMDDESLVIQIRIQGREQ